MKKFPFILTLFLVGFFAFAKAQQTVIHIEPLFEYPVAPDELKTLDEKCNYLVKVFWDNFNFKQKNALDQYALNEAFMVYASTFRYADKKEVDQSMDKLLKNLAGNPPLLMQFTKAAEENLYGPRAQFWQDELYLKMVDAVIKNKKIPAARKNKLIRQAETLRKSAVGQLAPSFWFIDKDRASKQYFPMSTPTILIFGNPEDTDWRLDRLKLESNFKLSEAIEKGKINILYIIPDEIENWQESVSNYNPKWTIGQSNESKQIYDIRTNPTVFVVGSDGKILKKYISPDVAADFVLELIN